MENQEETTQKSPAKDQAALRKERITPEKLNNLHSNEIFVFSSNLQGRHDSGDARIAFQRYGAEIGQCFGPQGRSYAIPTMQDDPIVIKPYAEEFIIYAKQHPEQNFLVTKIGCNDGCAPKDVAPLFRSAEKTQNIFLPQEFWDVLKKR